MSSPESPAAEQSVERVGVVVIGRNEGERLARCLDSLHGHDVVYVDSGSTDGSRELARARGADVVELDLSIPFTAARARNAGFERLTEAGAELEFVQFVDGDCEVDANWLARALQELRERPSVAVVCGRRRERAPEASIYNRLCDMEWNTPIGSTDACGGDALMRADAFRQVGGFDPALIAGEEPELCARLRGAGFGIWRIDAEMTLHDAAMTRIRQWGSRSMRAGHAAAERYWMHREPTNRQRVVSALFWGLTVPLTIVLGAVLAWVLFGALWSVLVLAGGVSIYALQALRISRGRQRRGDRADDARLYAVFCLLGKGPESRGVLRYLRNRISGKQSRLIEYKGASS